MLDKLSSQKALRSSYVYAMADTLEALGANRNEILTKAGIPKESSDNLSSYITIAQYQTFLEQALKVIKTPSLGLSLGSNLKFGNHGNFVFAVLSFPTAWDAIRVGKKFSNLVNFIVDVRMEEEERFHMIRIETFYLSPELYITVIEIVISMFFELFKFILEGDVGGIELRLNYQKPKYVEEYRKLFETDIEFEALYNEIRIPKKLAKTPLKMEDKIVADRFEKDCDEQLVHLKKEKTVCDQITDYFFAEKGKSLLLEDAASHLNMSPRTLRRHLQKENTSYRKISTQIKFEQAQRLLLMTRKTVGQISQELGYRDQNSFSHSFKVISGKSPSQFRKIKILKKN